jgi:hypothetical protein
MPSILNTGASVTLNAQGAGTVSVGPNMPGVTWTVTSVACFTSTANLVPTFYLYTPFVAPFNFVGGSYSGNNDQNTGLTVLLFPGQLLYGVWAGGDNGATATMSVYGTFTSPGNK